jgi:hypothetical protein
LSQTFWVNPADFTLTFRRLRGSAAGPNDDKEVRAMSADPGALDSWGFCMVPAPGRGTVPAPNFIVIATRLMPHENAAPTE